MGEYLAFTSRERGNCHVSYLFVARNTRLVRITGVRLFISLSLTLLLQAVKVLDSFKAAFGACIIPEDASSHV